MTERRFKLDLPSGCLSWDATGVGVKGEDRWWRYWIEFDGCCIPGTREFPPARTGYARLKACAEAQLKRVIWSSRHRDAPEDV